MVTRTSQCKYHVAQAILSGCTNHTLRVLKICYASGKAGYLHSWNASCMAGFTYSLLNFRVHLAISGTRSHSYGLDDVIVLEMTHNSTSHFVRAECRCTNHTAERVLNICYALGKAGYLNTATASQYSWNSIHIQCNLLNSRDRNVHLGRSCTRTHKHIPIGLADVIVQETTSICGKCIVCGRK